MIDWLKVELFCTHSFSISGDHLITLDRHGEVKWDLVRALGLVGSHDARIQIKTLARPIRPICPAGPLHSLTIEGNFVKYFQGHNIFGTGDIHTLIHRMINHLVKIPELGLTPTIWDKKTWEDGLIKIKRVDITESWDMGSNIAVDAWLKGTQVNAQVAYKGRSVYEQGTVYFGKHSKHWSMKFYNKAKELTAKGHKLHRDLHEKGLSKKAQGLLRGELVFRHRKLEAMDLNYLRQWKNLPDPKDPLKLDNPKAIFEDFISKMKLGTRIRVPDNELDKMPRSLRTAYTLWRNGEDVTAHYKRTQLYVIKKGLLEIGIDITAPRPKKAEIIPMTRYIEAKRVDAPADWHQEGLIFDPATSELPDELKAKER
jgi:II/X family phage/plasmid replication protein